MERPYWRVLEDLYRRGKLFFTQLFTTIFFQLFETFTGHTDGVVSAIFAADGEHILTASVDRAAKAKEMQQTALLGGFPKELGVPFWGSFFTDDYSILGAVRMQDVVRMSPDVGYSDGRVCEDPAAAKRQGATSPAGSSQNMGPIWVPLNIRCRNIIYYQRGPKKFENNPSVALGVLPCHCHCTLFLDLENPSAHSIVIVIGEGLQES